jgi:hypothetical protein
MSSLPVVPAPGWPADVANEESCKWAGEFFATWMTTPEQIKAKTYRGPGLEATVQYLRALFGTDSDRFSDGELLWWFADTQKNAERNGPEGAQQFMETYVQPSVTNCGASVCKSLGWVGNSDLAGIGVSTPGLCLTMAW